MEAIQQQMVEAKKNERASALKEVKRLSKEFSFTAGMLKGALAKAPSRRRGDHSFPVAKGLGLARGGLLVHHIDSCQVLDSGLHG